uniref:Uncharacterized protein n=1 Tax=Peronospora matthiolae TaxID=2874970 RepID=A0AAV1TBP4_9STRA
MSHGLEWDEDSSDEFLGPKISGLMPPHSPEPVNLALTVFNPVDPERDASHLSRMHHPICQNILAILQTHPLCESRHPLQMFLSHVVTQHVDYSQQALPVAELQQQAENHLLLRQEKYTLWLHTCSQLPSLLIR